MSEPADIVRDFCAAWSVGDLDAILAFFTPDAIYHNIPMSPVQGVDAIRATIESFSAGVVSMEFVVNAIAADGNTVLTERVDRFIGEAKTIELPVMGTFELVDGKIAAWRDYFDLNQFMSQLAD
jgi:limonene-1,2-epoxide hydrolase